MKFNCNNNTSSGCCSSNYKILGQYNVENIKLQADQTDTLNWKEISVPELISLPVENIEIEEINEVYSSVDITCSKLIETPVAIKYYQVALLNSDGTPVTLADGTVEQCHCDYIAGSNNGSTAFGFVPSIEGNCLTGRKVIVEGVIKQKILYTADVLSQSVHSLEVNHPFSTYVVVYPKFENASDFIRDIVVIDPNDSKNTLTIDGFLYSGDTVVYLCEDFCVKAYIEDIFITLLDCKTIFKNTTLFLLANVSPTY